MVTETGLDTYRLVLRAILNRQQVIATYRGRRRHMCPHVLGLKNKRPQALFYQFAGESSTGLEREGSGDNWRCMFLDELHNVEARSGEWHTAPNYSRSQACVAEMDVAIARVRRTYRESVHALTPPGRERRRGRSKSHLVRSRVWPLPVSQRSVHRTRGPRTGE
jgi:hypothetical protein